MFLNSKMLKKSYLCRPKPTTMRSFGSDNNSGVHPQVMEAILNANADHALAYGDDDWTLRATHRLKEVFGETAEPFFVFNGTGANTIAMRACCRPYHAIIAAATAHIAVDECNAPGYLSGAAIKEVATPDGKLTPDLIWPLLHGFGFEHHSQPRVVYVSEVTELGTVYTPAELRTLADFVHSYGMYLHIDGARLANAAVALGTTVRALTTDCGADIISFGGTKNGCMMAEAVIALRPELATELRYLRKQTTQLFSKMRYVAAQFLAYFDNELLYKNAAHANAMAQLLRRRIEETGNFAFTQPTQANTLLLKLAPDVTEQLLKNHFFYVWDEQTNEIRLVTSWDTTEEDIDSFVDDLKKIIEK